MNINLPSWPSSEVLGSKCLLLPAEAVGGQEGRWLDVGEDCLRASLSLESGWGWQGVEAEAGCPWFSYRTIAAPGSRLAHPWPVGPYSTPGFRTGPHNLGREQTGTGTDSQEWGSQGKKRGRGRETFMLLASF